MKTCFRSLGHIGLISGGAGLQACSVASNFKAVAEMGDWSHLLTVAHRMYNAGEM